MKPESGGLVSRGRDSEAAELRGAGTRQAPSEVGMRLLLLEDDEALRQMLAWELAELGYHVHLVGSCGEARAAVAAHAFDLALFDVGLPDGDGTALAAELTESDPNLGIILCSGKPRALDQEPVPQEVIACLTKPVSVHRLDALFRSPDCGSGFSPIPTTQSSR